MWWGPQNIPLNLHYPLPLFGPLGVTGARWEQAGSEGSELGVSLAPNRGGGHPKLGPTGGGDPKRYPSISIMPYLHLVHWE